MSDTELDTKTLDKLLRILKKSTPEIRIGIFGSTAHSSKNKSSQKTLTNAALGAIHEYGSLAQGIPARSFLRMPIADHFGPRVEQTKELNENTVKDVIKTGNFLPLVEKLAVIAEDTVMEAFDTGGFGKWKKWKNKNYTNNTGQLLLNTQQLRNSITTEIKGGDS